MQKLKQLVQSENPACECLVTLSSEAAGTSLSDAYCWCVCVCVCVCVWEREYALKIYCISVKWAPHLHSFHLDNISFTCLLRSSIIRAIWIFFLPIISVLYSFLFQEYCTHLSSFLSLALAPILNAVFSLCSFLLFQRLRHSFLNRQDRERDTDFIRQMCDIAHVLECGKNKERLG